MIPCRQENVSRLCNNILSRPHNGRDLSHKCEPASKERRLAEDLAGQLMKKSLPTNIPAFPAKANNNFPIFIIFQMRIEVKGFNAAGFERTQ